MNSTLSVPDFWRTEIWHPLLVHFPIATLILGSGLILLGTVVKNKFLSDMSKVLLVLGTLCIWFAIYTGDLADSVVARKLCDPTVLESHETNGIISGWIFSLVSILILMDYFKIAAKLKYLMKYIIVSLSLIGSAFLIVTGHLGATLVYQQAAGVYMPSETCLEFQN